MLISVGIAYVYWLEIKHWFHEHLKPTQHYRFTEPTLLAAKYIHFRPSNTVFLWGSIDTLRIELVDHVAAAVAVGVGFDVILWYFIWLCWFDCARSSILPDVSRHLSKAFCFIGLLVYPPEFQWSFDGINAPFECRPWSCRGEEAHAEWACMETESQMSEESVEGRNFLQMQILHWSGISNVQISHTGFWSVTKKKGALLFQITANLH